MKVWLLKGLDGRKSLNQFAGLADFGKVPAWYSWESCVREKAILRPNEAKTGVWEDSEPVERGERGRGTRTGLLSHPPKIQPIKLKWL